MPETRAQRRRQQERAGATAGRQGRGRGRATIVPQPPTFVPPVVGHSGIRYNTQGLSPDSAMRASEGLGSDFFVDRLRSHETSNGTYYAIQLMKPISVRIHDPTKGANSVECTCGDQNPCIHIYWLFDGLQAVFDNRSTTSPRGLSSESMVTEEISDLYDLIGENLGTLPHKLNRTRGSEQSSDTDDEMDDATARSRVLIDMLSIFNKEQLPEEYGSGFLNLPTDTALEDMEIPETLAGTIYGLAMRDESFRSQFRKLINRDVCANHYLTKQRRRAQRAIVELERPSNDPSLKVFECGDTLRRIVREICQEREARTSNRPLSLRTLNKAAEVLVEILEDVCKQNINIKELTSPSPAREADANLYTYLIGDPPPFPEGDFVIDQLQNFPQNEWRHLLEYLTTIADYVRNNAREGQLRSIRYAKKIDAMVNEYTSSAFEPSSSSHRRPASSSERESRRPRYH